MSAGLLRERVIFERRIVSEDDGYGNELRTWQAEGVPVAARIQYLKAGEDVMGQRLSGVQPVVITVRSSAFTRGITSDWRARDPRSDKTFNLKAPRPDERGAYLDFLATAGGADG